LAGCPEKVACLIDPEMTGKRYVIVDAMNLAYRSFYGVKHSLTTTDGTPTNALFGFIRAMDLLREQWQPTHWQVIFDGGIPEHRQKLVPEYKAQRKPMPDDLRVQLDPINEYLEAAKIATLVMDAQEADDVIASLAHTATSCPDDQNVEVFIATTDKDIYQMVSDRISIISTKRDAVPCDPAGVLEKMGVRPDQIVDWLALIGDAADNIKGLQGVGKITAAKWLNEYPSIEAIYTHIDQIKPHRFQPVLQEGKALVERNQKMIRLDLSLQGAMDWNKIRVKQPAGNTLHAFYKKYQLHSLAKTFNPMRQTELLF